jgi:hypothetical protein
MGQHRDPLNLANSEKEILEGLLTRIVIGMLSRKSASLRNPLRTECGMESPMCIALETLTVEAGIYFSSSTLSLSLSKCITNEFFIQMESISARNQIQGGINSS